MANQTAFLALTLPLNSEFTNTWDQPLNGNFQAIDAFASAISGEVVAARGNLPNLAARLAVGMDNDGNLLPTPEVVLSRQSFAYGDSDLSGLYNLVKRLYYGDREVWDAREQALSLRASIAFGRPNYILSGSMNVNGYPTWLGNTGANALIGGLSQPLLMFNSGYLSRVRTNASVAISGGAGTYYVWSQFQLAGVVRIDNSTGSPNAVVSSNGSKVNLLTDATTNFTTSDVQVGDVIQIMGSGTNAGFYQVQVIAPGANVNQLQIVGYFPGGAMAGLNYTVSDPLASTLGFSSTQTPATGKLYIGEVDFDGTAITAVRPRNFKNNFISEWRAIDVSSISTFEQIFNHTLGSLNLDVVVQVSQANDGSQPVETLSMATINDSRGLAFSNTLTFSPGTFTPNSSGAVYSPLPSLTGTVTSSLTGSTVIDHSAAVKFTTNTINVKNVTPSIFYKDYGGVTRQTGFIRVLIKVRN